MAGSSKGKTSRTIVWIILLLVIVGLGGYGTRNFGGNVTSIGSVGDTPIAVTRYVRALRQRINDLSTQTGQNVTFTQARQFGVDAAVLQRLISTVALENEAADLQLSVGDKTVRKQLLGISAFQGVDGKFDREAYKFSLDQAGLKENEFEESLRAEISSTVVQGAVTAGIEVPSIYTDTILNYVAERRSFAWTALRAGDLVTPIAEPDQSDLKTYYDAHNDDFMLPESRAITYAWLTPEMIVDTIEADEEALKALYQSKIDSYVRPERRLVERLVFGTEEEAQSALASINSGETTFDDVVAARGLTLTDIDLGDVTRAELGNAGDAIFALDAPGLAGPVETDLGPALFRMNGVLPAQETSFVDARSALLSDYALERARKLIGDQVENIDDLLAGGATLEEVTNETDMQLGTIDWSTGVSKDIAADSAFRTAAASASPEDFPQVAQLQDGGIYAMRVDKITEPHLEPFEDAAAEVEAGWRRTETTRGLEAQALALADQLRSGLAPEDLGLTLADATDMTRNASVPDAPADLLAGVFTMSEGDYRVITSDTAAYLVRLDKVLPPDTDNPEISSQITSFENATRQSLGLDLLDSYAKAIQSKAGITLNQAAINAVHAQFN